MKKLVIFDWGGVIESHDKSEASYQECLINFLKKHSKNNYTDEEIFNIWNKYGAEEKLDTLSEFPDIKRWFLKLRKALNLENELFDYMTFYEKEMNTDYYQDVIKYIYSLKDKCFIGLLSNLSIFDYDRLSKELDLEQFDYIWLSYYLNVKKPDKEIYDIVEKESNISKENILFIDDTIENINTAKYLGWNTCLANGHDLAKIKEVVDKFLNNK